MDFDDTGCLAAINLMFQLSFQEIPSNCESVAANRGSLILRLNWDCPPTVRWLGFVAIFNLADVTRIHTGGNEQHGRNKGYDYEASQKYQCWIHYRFFRSFSNTMDSLNQILGKYTSACHQYFLASLSFAPGT